MDGLKSKNARQRAECLEVMGTIIEDHGLNVCLPSPASCLKEVAKQISDRDNSVRQAALNCVVQAYYEVGDKVYKMVGQVSSSFITGRLKIVECLCTLKIITPLYIPQILANPSIHISSL